LHYTYNLAYSAKNAVNDHLSQTPELYLLALTGFAILTDMGVVSATLFRSIANLTNVTDAFVIACPIPQASFSGQPHLKHNNPKITPAKRRVYLYTTSCPPLDIA
jgi:hypothetical protein